MVSRPSFLFPFVLRTKALLIPPCSNPRTLPYLSLSRLILSRLSLPLQLCYSPSFPLMPAAIYDIQNLPSTLSCTTYRVAEGVWLNLLPSVHGLCSSISSLKLATTFSFRVSLLARFLGSWLWHFHSSVIHILCLSTVPMLAFLSFFIALSFTNPDSFYIPFVRSFPYLLSFLGASPPEQDCSRWVAHPIHRPLFLLSFLTLVSLYPIQHPWRIICDTHVVSSKTDHRRIICILPRLQSLIHPSPIVLPYSIFQPQPQADDFRDLIPHDEGAQGRSICFIIPVTISLCPSPHSPSVQYIHLFAPIHLVVLHLVVLSFVA
jgi:hypothetical protein